MVRLQHINFKFMERIEGFEPSTFCVEHRHSTTELYTQLAYRDGVDPTLLWVKTKGSTLN